MKNKKGIMFFAGLLILIFHLWINVFPRGTKLFEIESFIRSISYIGVDIFFFLSAYSISSRKIDDYKKFVISRFKKVYLVFVIFALIAFFVKGTSIEKLLFNIFGISFFLKGGGSFLWFVPAIMIVYILLPLYFNFEDKHKVLAPSLITVAYVLTSILVSNFTNYDAIFILLNRLPIIMLGYYFAKYDLIKRLSNVKYWLLTIFIIIIGIVILYLTWHTRFTFIKDFYYVLAVPLTLGLILFINKLPSLKIIEKVGSITLYLYAFQMVFGFQIAEAVLKNVKNVILSNIVTLLLVIILSYVVYLIFNELFKLLDKIKFKKTI